LFSKSLKNRLLLWFGTVLTIILILFSFSFYYLLNKNINLTIKSDLYKHAVVIKNLLSDKKRLKRYIQDTKSKNLGIAVFQNKHFIIKNQSFTLRNTKKFLISKKDFFILDDEGETLNALYILKSAHPSSSIIFVYKKYIDDKGQDIGDTLGALTPLLMIILMFAASRLIDKILNPIKEITSAIDDITITNFKTTIPQSSNEFKKLIDSYNDMIARLEEGVNTLDRFNSDVSHELKTPLTVISGEAELALRKNRSTDEYKQSLSVIQYEASQIQNIVSNLLLLTKYNADNITQSFQECDLADILTRVLKQYDKQITAKRLSLHVKALRPVVTMANPTLMASIFSNLIDNAIKYSNFDTQINIWLYKEGAIHLIVEDEGIGIEKEQISKITGRFYRIDPSRNKDIKGFGLGLAIVKQAVTLHHGTITITSKPQAGTSVHVTM